MASPAVKSPAQNASVSYDPVERRRNLSVREFKREYFNQRPVIVEDCMDEWKARSLWTFEGLRSRFGDSTILAYYYENGKYREDLTKRLKLCEYIDDLLAGDFQTYPYYGRDNHSLFVEHRELWDEFRDPKFCFDWFRVIFPKFMLRPGPRIFIGPKGATTNLHQDMWGTHFWLAQLAGRKRWVLFSPDQYQFLHDYCWNIRPDQPDLRLYPRYTEAHGLECILSPGETIIVPRGWVHWVNSLDPTISLTHNYMGPGNFVSCLTGQFRWTLAAWLHKLN